MIRIFVSFINLKTRFFFVFFLFFFFLLFAGNGELAFGEEERELEVGEGMGKMVGYGGFAFIVVLLCCVGMCGWVSCLCKRFT